jgi:hypothetical protein
MAIWRKNQSLIISTKPGSRPTQFINNCKKFKSIIFKYNLYEKGISIGDHQRYNAECIRQ